MFQSFTTTHYQVSVDSDLLQETIGWMHICMNLRYVTQDYSYSYSYVVLLSVAFLEWRLAVFKLAVSSEIKKTMFLYTSSELYTCFTRGDNQLLYFH